jgi:hypothetical protein
MEHEGPYLIQKSPPLVHILINLVHAPIPLLKDPF